jgi:hypothetical protein
VVGSITEVTNSTVVATPVLMVLAMGHLKLQVTGLTAQPFLEPRSVVTGFEENLKVTFLKNFGRNWNRKEEEAI